MTKFEIFWARVVAKNPGFGGTDDTKVTMPIAAVRKLVQKAHADGFHGGLETAKGLKDIGNVRDPLTDLFNEFE
jgi:hypothetical protein